MATNKFQTDSSRWAAVRARDPAADGSFLYGVKTTKIYCRPTCKARLARRSNVVYFNQIDEALSNGFRACLRCKPNINNFVSDADRSIRRIRSRLESLPEHAPLPKLETLALDAGLTKYHFHRCFKKATGMTPRAYALSRRQSRQAFATPDTIVVQSSSTSSAPSLLHDSGLSSCELTPDMAEPLDVNFDDWLADDSADPLLTSYVPIGPQDLDLPPSLTDEDANSSLEDAIKTALIYDIHYTVVETIGGVLLMAFQGDQICKLELCLTLKEAVDSLEKSFPTCIYVHVPTECLYIEKSAPLQSRVAAVVEAIESPLDNESGLFDQLGCYSSML